MVTNRLPSRVWALLFLGCLFATPSLEADDSIEFERDIAPLLARHCVSCHGANGPRGQLDLTTAAGLERGGVSGAVIIRGDAASSLLIQRVEDGEMPAPLHASTNNVSLRLPDAAIERLRRWIDQGAAWPPTRVLDIYEQTTDDRAGYDWWALQSIQRPRIPTGEPGDRAANPIDRFVLVKLREAGLTMAPRAEARALVRRLYYDLLGMPPSYEVQERFADHPSPDAYRQLVDELLASPHYGERWGRHWLDVVRYADTCGYERDQPKPHIWRYRDWVIRALNDDMPYDRFVTDQLAGDEVPWRDEQSVIATGMLRAGTWNDEPNDPEDYLYDRLEDMVHTTTSAFLGLSVKCARCHDHKFDPIRQTDYYRVASFFWAGYLGQANLGGPSSEQLGYDVFGWTDRSAVVEPIRRLRNGERAHPEETVDPGFLSAIRALDAPLRAPPSSSHSTHRRLQFAEWLTDARHPLTSRVIINRLWQHHFGQAIVRTPNNFGRKSDPPSHPELLDWLASELMDNGWQLKPLHRLIVTSEVYCQSADHPNHGTYEQRDYDNRWLWHASRQRLDAESLRDSLLAASGSLQSRMGGPSFSPHMSSEALEGLSRKDGDWQESPPQEQARRSVYMLTKRSRLLPLMTVFDFSDTTVPCAQRDVTTVPLQALAMLNNDFIHAQSLTIARRARQTCDAANIDQQMQVIWRWTLGRDPSADELALGRTHVSRLQSHLGSDGQHAEAALASLCHVLLNTNEFLYVD